ncbi:MAG: DNA polymerase III subunit beta [Spirochaetota bacterium]
MKFTCDKMSLLREISLAQEIINTKNALSIMSNVYLEASESKLVIRATDVKVGFETSIPVEGLEPGSLTVFCDKLMGILTSMPEGEILFEQDEGRVVLRPKAKKVRFQLKTLSGEKFPEIPAADKDAYFQVPAGEFKKMILQTIFSVSTDETRFFMNGVFMEKNQEGSLVLVSTDGRRLAFVKKGFSGGVPDFKPVIIPTKVLSMLVKHLPEEGSLSVALTEKFIFFKFFSKTLTSVLIEGQFPNYQKVIPQNQNKSFKVKKSELQEALKRVSIFVEQKSNRTYFNLSDSKLVLSSEETDIGAAREELDFEFQGEDAVIALNYRYVEEPLKVLEDETLLVEFSDPSRAITLKPYPKGDAFHIVMPMQIE